jgi:hypothetical protein
MSSYFFLNLDIPTRKGEMRERSSGMKDLCKFGLVDMLTQIHGYNVLENNPWLKPKARLKVKKRVSFKPTEIFGRDCTLPQCINSQSLDKESGHLHATHCRNFLQETPEVLGQHVWMNRKFLIKSRFLKA